jgi:predicted ribosome quality control (RQC) complex YloA/Tae2 family protein
MEEKNTGQTECEEHVIRYGMNAKGNTRLIENAEGCDVWFHVDEYASAHVICERESPLSPLSDSVIRFCADLCVERTPALKRQGLKKVQVVYTPVSNLKLGKAPGEVEIKNTSSEYLRRISINI